MGSYRLVKMLNPVSITVAGTFTPKGAYSGSTSYSVGDQVDYNGTSYILYSAASAGTLPTDNTKWGVLASKGDTGSAGTPGTNGIDGAKGDKGDKGDTGAMGIQGVKGDTGAVGATGATGSPGSNGTNGTNGQGVPTGGTTGQQLAKINGTDYNTQWVNPVDISGKQDTLVSGTSIKTVNSTSLLGSGDIVIGGAVDSVNTQTGAVVLDTDDISEGTNKYVTSAEKTKLSNTSGVNTGDQDISGIATNASNITGKVSKSGDTMTGNLAVNGSIYSSGNLGASNWMTLAIYNDTNYSDGLSIYKSGSAGVLGGAVKDGGEVGYHSFYAFDGTSDKRVAFVLVGADGDTTPTTGGGRYDIYVRNSAGTQVLPLSLTGANAEYQVNPIARTSLTYNLGSTARYWLNTYTQKLYLNSTAYLDGSTAGQINLTGNLALSGADTTVSLTGVTTEPSAPSTGQLKIYSKEIAGKMFPKTVGPSGIDSPLQNAFWQNNICIWQPTTASNGLWLGTAPASAGTYATVLPTSTSLYTAMKRGRWSNIATTANQVLTQRSLELMYFLGNSAGMGGFFFYTRMGFDTWTDGGRLFAGLFNGNSLIQSDPSTVNNNIGFAVDVADNGLIYFQTKGTGAAVRTSTGFTITSGSGYDMYIFAAPNSTTVSWRILEINTGTEATGSSAVSGPAVNVMMMAGIQASNAALTSVNDIQLCINRIYVETDR